MAGHSTSAGKEIVDVKQIKWLVFMKLICFVEEKKVDHSKVKRR